MSNNKTGGSAFPVIENDSYGNPVAQHMGLTIRDYFAAKCCAAMVATIRDDRDYGRLRDIANAHDLNSISQFFAREAYKQADAMLAERAK